jgi:hypothetical protein
MDLNVEYYNITSYGTTSIKKDGTYLKASTHDVYWHCEFRLE